MQTYSDYVDSTFCLETHLEDEAKAMFEEIGSLLEILYIQGRCDWVASYKVVGDTAEITLTEARGYSIEIERQIKLWRY